MPYKSDKVLGKYEAPLMALLKTHFEEEGYEVYLHSSLNLPWHGALCDLDVLALRDGLITVIEVKSRHDNVKRAYVQLSKYRKYADYVYLAVEKLPDLSGWGSDFGVILIQWGVVKVVRLASRVHWEFPAFNLLKTDCMRRLIKYKFGKVSRGYLTQANTWEIVKNQLGDDYLEKIYRDVLLCDQGSWKNPDKCKKCLLEDV